MLGERHLAKVPAQLFWAVLAASCVCASAAAPAIVITNLPIYGTTSNLAGVIRSDAILRRSPPNYSGLSWPPLAFAPVRQRLQLLSRTFRFTELPAISPASS